MTLLITEVREQAIVMAADSNEIRGNEIIELPSEDSKIIYFPDLNLLAGTWGDADVGETDSVPINDFLRDNIPYLFRGDYDFESAITELARRFGSRYDFTRGDLTFGMGVHIAGFESGAPRVFHVFKDHCCFKGQREYAEPNLPNTFSSYYQLRNGEYRSFAKNFDYLNVALSNFSRDLRNETTGEEFRIYNADPSVPTSAANRREIFRMYSYEVGFYILLAAWELQRFNILRSIGGPIIVHVITGNPQEHRLFKFSFLEEEI